jgi:tetratricopeptide (TPR) repeat protein
MASCQNHSSGTAGKEFGPKPGPALTMAQVQKLNALQQEEVRAEKAGDFAKADSLYSQMLAIGERQRLVDRKRYMLFEKEGKGREAFIALRNGTAREPGIWPTDWRDPVILTHLAVLADRYGTHEEAMSYFRAAVSAGSSSFVPALQPRLDSLNKEDDIKSAAFYMAGGGLAFRPNQTEAIEMMRQAVRLGPYSPLAHFGLGYVLFRTPRSPGSKELLDEAHAELRRAELMATGEVALAIRQEVRMMGAEPGRPVTQDQKTTR